MAGCVPLGVPARPTYDAACVPSDPTYLQLARSTVDHPELELISTDPAAALAEALAEAGRLGLTVRPKRPTELAQWDGFSTTLPGVVLLATDWPEKSIEVKAVTLWHEVGVHGRQYARLGAERFLLTYAVPEGRWALEVAAYGFSLQLQLHLGVDPELVRSELEERAHRLRPSYRLGDLPACTVETTAVIWRQQTGL